MTEPAKKKPSTRKQPRKLAAEQKAKLAERRAQVMRYVLAGATVREIAEKLGVSPATVINDKARSLTELAEQEQMAAKDYRQMEDARLNKILVVVWPAALKGEPWAMDKVFQIHERKARLFGYDAIPKIELMTRDALSEFLTRLEAHLDPETFNKVLAICAVDASGA